MVQGIFRVIYTLTYNALLEMNLFTPRASRYSTIPYDSIVEYASKAAGITENDMRLTMEALMEAFSYYLCNGHSFKIDGVGTFSLSANTKTGDPTSEDCLEGADAVERLRVNFLPDVKLKNLCNGLSLYTESENPNNLVPTTSPVLRTLVMNGAKLVSEGVATEEGSMEKGVNVVTVSGFNIPKDAFAVIIKPQLVCSLDKTELVVFYLKSSSNHNQQGGDVKLVVVVFYLKSSSNHNSAFDALDYSIVVFYLKSLSNHNQ